MSFPDPIATDDKSTSEWLQGRTVAFVGKLGGVNRKHAKQIVRDAGGQVAEKIDQGADLIVIGADQSPADDYGKLLSDVVIERSGAGELEIISETEWWQRMGLVDEDGQSSRRLYTPAMLADLLNVPITTIRRWHRRGLIRPVTQIHRLPYFDFVEVASARQLARMISRGQSPQVIESRLQKLAERFPGLQKPLSQLSVILEGRHVLLRQGDGLVDSAGQMRINFDLLEPEEYGQNPTANSPATQTADVVGFPISAETAESIPKTAEEFLTLASDLEDDGHWNDAIQVYRTMQIALGPSAEASFRMAELMYANGKPEPARERYSVAIELAPDFVEARASLGGVLIELGQTDLAIAAFQGALEIHPDYPDVHYHLARLLDEQQADGSHAETHWLAFLRLAPQSPWAAEARQRLGLELHGLDD